MSPRPYRSEARQTAAAETRARIVEAARTTLIAEPPGRFTIDAVAAAAGVARMTVYHQFGSKPGLVEALHDDLARRGGIGRLPEAFKAPDAATGLGVLIEVFTGMWASQREVLRRLRAYAALDPEIAGQDRNAWRRRALATLLARLAAERGRPAAEEMTQVTDLLQVVTSFEAYEILAGGGREPDEIAKLVTATAQRLLGI